MTRYGSVVLGLMMTAGVAVAQEAPPANQGAPYEGQQAALPSNPAYGELLSSVQNGSQAGQRISTLGRLPAHKVEVRNAYEIAQNSGNADQLAQAVDDHRQSVEDLRQSLINNKSVNRTLARDQVPINNVVGADVQPGGRVVVYAYPQTRVPPQ